MGGLVLENMRWCVSGDIYLDLRGNLIVSNRMLQVTRAWEFF